MSSSIITIVRQVCILIGILPTLVVGRVRAEVQEVQTTPSPQTREPSLIEMIANMKVSTNASTEVSKPMLIIKQDIEESTTNRLSAVVSLHRYTPSFASAGGGISDSRVSRIFNEGGHNGTSSTGSEKMIQDDRFVIAGHVMKVTSGYVEPSMNPMESLQQKIEHEVAAKEVHFTDSIAYSGNKGGIIRITKNLEANIKIHDKDTVMVGFSIPLGKRSND